ncbi:hypothetical protein ACYOEI_34165, partial [Singulisphaera rosea]
MGTEPPIPGELSGGEGETRADDGPRTYAGRMLGWTARVVRLAIIVGGVATEIHRLSATLVAVYPRPDLVVVAMVGAIASIVVYVVIARAVWWLAMSIAALADAAVYQAEASTSLHARIASALERALDVLVRPASRLVDGAEPPLSRSPES